MGEGLEWLSSVLWGAPEVRVVLGSVAPPGYRIAERYAVVPNARRARFLIPMADRLTCHVPDCAPPWVRSRQAVAPLLIVSPNRPEPQPGRWVRSPQANA